MRPRQIDGIAHTYRRRDESEARPYNPFHAHDDAYQQDVYDVARRYMDECAAVWDRHDDPESPLLVDWGCGSGRKLVARFGVQESVGVDLPPVVERLHALWPNRVWLPSTHRVASSVRADVIVCADVLEHVARPDQVLDALCAMMPTYLVLSTPAREFVRGGNPDGPPTNRSHLREWSYAEFGLWVTHWLDVAEHWLINEAHGTQCVVGRPKRAV